MRLVRARHQCYPMDLLKLHEGLLIRDSRNVEILAYTELYERAYFLVNQKPLQGTTTKGRYDW